jgi:ribosomal-protein-alanine N-acetyltransferase
MNTTGKLTLSGPACLDWKMIQHIDQEYFPRPWAEDDWASLEMNHHRLYAWSQDNQLLGFALFGLVEGDDTAHLLKICLVPKVRGLGVGKTFWRELVSQLKTEGILKAFLEVEESNDVAVFFYQKLGFQTIRSIKGFYSDGTTGLMMITTL